MCRIVGAVGLVCALTSASITAQSVSGVLPPSDASVGLPSTIDFPTRDEQAWELQRHGLGTKTAVDALAKAPDRPGTIWVLMKVGRFDDALTVMRRIVDARPNDMAAGFAALNSNWMGFVDFRNRTPSASLRRIIEDAKRRIETLPKRQAAEVALEIAVLDSIGDQDPASPLTYFGALVAKYPGTEAAHLAQVEMLAGGDNGGPRVVNRLDAFIAAHPGTLAAAKALYWKGVHLDRDGSLFGEREGSDPTERFFRLVDVYKQLASGSYPASEWTEKAPSLLSEFESNDPSYAPSNVDRVLAVYEEVLSSLVPSIRQDTVSEEIRSIVGRQVWPLFKIKGHSIAALDGVFDRLERLSKSPDDVRLRRAEYYLDPYGFDLDETEGVQLQQKGIAGLESLVSQSTGYPHRKALATLAFMRFVRGNLTAARDLYRQYLETYPGSDYAWVVTLRIGQIEERLGNTTSATEAFRNAATRFPANPLAVVLGHAYAGRLTQTAGDSQHALAEYQAAVARWDGDYGDRYIDITRDALQTRIWDLKEHDGTNAGDPVERGRWLIEHERWDQAIASLRPFVADHSSSPQLPGARQMLHRAQLERALQLADVTSPQRDIKTARSELRSLAREAVGFEIVVAKLSLATLAYTTGSANDADPLVADAVTAWQALDKAKLRAPADFPLYRDVVDIRNAIYQPGKGGVLSEWSSLHWTDRASRYVTVSSGFSVRSSEGKVTVVPVWEPLPSFDNVLFLDDERRQLLYRVWMRLGAIKYTGAIEPVEQTTHVGTSPDIDKWWETIFGTLRNHHGAMLIDSYPLIEEIEFPNEERTRATVNVSVGDGGATVRMEKKDGLWIARELTRIWTIEARSGETLQNSGTLDNRMTGF